MNSLIFLETAIVTTGFRSLRRIRLDLGALCQQRDGQSGTFSPGRPRRRGVRLYARGAPYRLASRPD